MFAVSSSRLGKLEMSLLFNYLILIFNGFIQLQAHEAVLMDTRVETSDLGWIKSSDSKWEEVSSHHPEAAEQRMLVVCEIHHAKQDNWIRTPYIPIKGANRIYIEFEFTMRSCEGISQVATCKETFNLYYYETDQNEATSTFPPWTEEAYNKVDTIAADKRFHNGSKEINFETRDIGPLKKNGIYIALQDTGACLAIMYVRVFYKYCPPIVKNLADFLRTNAGPEATSLVSRDGFCVENALKEERINPTLYCNGDGLWVVPKGQCTCEAGYHSVSNHTKCQACEQGFYKPLAGNGKCRKCPAYSHSPHTGASICECMVDHYRAPSDQAASPCTQPPGRPTSLQAVHNDTSLLLTWGRPNYDGGRRDLTYRVECFECQKNFFLCSSCSGGLEFIPSQSNLLVTKVKVQGISSKTYHKFAIYSENGVSHMSEMNGVEGGYASITVPPLKRDPPQVGGVAIVKVESNLVVASWNVMTSDDHPSRQYDVIVTDYRNQTRMKTITTRNGTATVVGLSPNNVYFIKVRARNGNGAGSFSSPIKFRTGTSSLVKTTDQKPEGSFNFLHTLMGALVGTIFIIIMIFLILYRKRRRQHCMKKNPIDFKQHPMFNTSTLLTPGIFSSPYKAYVDPTTYGNPQRALLDFTKELSASCVSIETTIGGGEFGDVCRGYVRSSLSEEKKVNVAIKTLKAGYSNDQKQDFLSEASIMGQFDHPNVIHLEGVVTRNLPLMIITEYMENGALDSFLRKYDGQLTVIQLVGMLRNVASGMKYLSDMGYIHRDLAARNILINSDLVCKVSDFGLSRELEEKEDATYTTRGGKIPIRWTAPEAITYRKFTSASDVWSYGIVMWEVMSYGERPYWGMTNRDVMAAVETGYRLPAPMDCPLLQHQLMLECWKKDRNERPKFSSILLYFDRMILDPEQLKITANSRKGNEEEEDQSLSEYSSFNSDVQTSLIVPLDESQSPLMNPSSLGSWLDSLGLAKYKESFLNRGYVTIEQIVQINSRSMSGVWTYILH